MSRKGRRAAGMRLAPPIGIDQNAHELVAVLFCRPETQKARRIGGLFLYMVAGAGFEPAAFR
ncbi:hypothetical protein PYR71_29625, partial [Rhizobium sp. MC63]